MAVEIDNRLGAQLSDSSHYTPSVYPVVVALLSGQTDQWQTLVTRVHRLALRICQYRQSTRGDDFANNVALRTIEKLHRDEYKALTQYVEHQKRYPELSFEKWVRGLINNALIDEIRSLPSIGRTRSMAGRTLVKREHLGFEDERHSAMPSQTISETLDVRRILRWIHHEDFPHKQRDVLLLWLHGHSVQECGDAMNLDAAVTRRLLDSARQRLRRQFEERN